MSNVLIGIIGVILFIGLALAGALFLGPRFGESRNTSVASATVQAISQVSNAVNLSNIESVSKMPAGTDPETLATGKFLKSVPSNPAGADAIRIVSAQGQSASGDASMVVVKLDGAADQVCGAIVKQTKNGQDIVGVNGYPVASTAAQLPTGPAGCFRADAQINSFDSGSFYAFSRI